MARVELPLVELTRPTGHPSGKMADTAVAFDVALEQPWGSPNIYVLIGVGAQRARTFPVPIHPAMRDCTCAEALYIPSPCPTVERR